MASQFSAPRGTGDILPAEMPAWAYIERKFRDILSTYNYGEIRTPCFEESELFSRSMGQTSDVVQKQMLNLMPQAQDPSAPVKASLSLRPEGTASVVRSYIEHSLDRKEGLSKLFYFGPMFRGERPQKGRLRQFHQIGAEAIGPDTNSPYLDAEVIALSVHLLKSLGLNNFVLKINSLGTPEDKQRFSDWLRDQLKAKRKDLCEDCQNRYERNVFRVLDCKNKGCGAIVRDLELGLSHLSDESRLHFNRVLEALDAAGVDKSLIQPTPSLVRGLDYYTHTVFELNCADLGSQDALGAGGRYNRLVHDLGGPMVDAVGFALGLERILLALDQSLSLPAKSLDAFVVAMDHAAFDWGYKLCHNLRHQGLKTDIGYKLSSMKSQMRSANKQGARFVVIIGEEELSKKSVTVKNMETSQQEVIPVADDNVQALCAFIKERDE